MRKRVRKKLRNRHIIGIFSEWGKARSASMNNDLLSILKHRGNVADHIKMFARYSR